METPGPHPMGFCVPLNTEDMPEKARITATQLRVSAVLELSVPESFSLSVACFVGENSLRPSVNIMSGVLVGRSDDMDGINDLGAQPDYVTAGDTYLGAFGAGLTIDHLSVRKIFVMWGLGLGAWDGRKSEITALSLVLTIDYDVP